jgi:hypothetical protein
MLDVSTPQKESPLKYDILELLSNLFLYGVDLPRLRKYTYLETDLLSDVWQERPPVAESNQSGSKVSIDSIKRKSSPDWKSKSEIEEIEIACPRLDTQVIKRILQVPSGLVAFKYTYAEFMYASPFTISDVCAVMKAQAHSLQAMSISFPMCTFPRTMYLAAGSSTNISPDTVLSRITAEQMSLGSLREFKRLKTLVVPFDALLGPNPQTSTSFAELLPPSLEEIVLRECIFLDTDSVGTWDSLEVITAVTIGVDDLPHRCPHLKNLKLPCLDHDDFLGLKESVEQKRQRHREEKGALQQQGQEGGLDKRNNDEKYEDNQQEMRDGYGFELEFGGWVYETPSDDAHDWMNSYSDDDDDDPYGEYGHYDDYDGYLDPQDDGYDDDYDVDDDDYRYLWD